MKLTHLYLLLPIMFACAVSEGGGDRSIAAPSSGSLSYNDPSRIDLDGDVDLIVDPKATENHWRVKNEIITSNLCSAIEGGVTPGDRRLLRFTVTTPNQGTADNFIGDPRAHVAANDGLFEFDTCHNHFHFQHYATYELIDAAPPHKVWRAAKRGFCMLDTDPYLPSLRDAPRNYWNCGNQDFAGFQGISKGWNDTYVWKLGGQYFVLDGGDGQAAVPAGEYIIRITVNPPYAPPVDKRGSTLPCPRFADPAGMCHQFKESNYANNVTEVKIWIAASGPSGPEKNSKDPTAADDIEGNGIN